MTYFRLICLAGFLNVFNQTVAQKTYDSLQIKLPEHYFNTVITVNGYRKPEQQFRDKSNSISDKLGSYGIKQMHIGFYAPLITRDFSVDSVTHGNTHLLLTGNFMSLRPVFGGLELQHNLIKAGIGVRYIYNSGKKGLWFFEGAPFVTRDVSYPSKPYYRLASTILYSHNPSMFFNWRIGVTKSFLWGNRNYIPFVGIRIGRLDKINLSLQFPRAVSFNVPIGSNAIFSIYSRPQGGMFNFSNRDSLYFNYEDATFHFTRYELNSGVRIDVRSHSDFNFYFAAGISSKNSITFYSERKNSRGMGSYNEYFYSKKTGPGIFLELGLTFKFGKTKSYLLNKNIYDAMDLNNVMDQNGNVQIPMAPKKLSAQNLEAVRDLLEYNDF